MPYELAPAAALLPVIVNNSSRLNNFKASNHSHVEISDKLVLAQLITVWTVLASNVEIRQISFGTTYSLDRVVLKFP